MKHYVYEIIGDKVGSTEKYPQRPIDQGAKEGEYRLLWEGDSKVERLKVEAEWQEKLGYKKDPFHGHLTFKQQKDAHTITIVKDEKKLHTLIENKSVILNTEYGLIKFKGEEEIQALSDILTTGPYGGWFVKVKMARNLREQLNEKEICKKTSKSSKRLEIGQQTEESSLQEIRKHNSSSSKKKQEKLQELSSSKMKLKLWMGLAILSWCLLTYLIYAAIV